MAYSNIEIYTTDIDWFIYDSSKTYIHVASAGGVLPEIIRVNNELNERNTLEVLSLRNAHYEYEINPNILQLAQIERQELSIYLNDFVSMAKKGFYSFDKSHLESPEDTMYHLVARPIGRVLIREGLLSSEFLIEESLLDQINSWKSLDLISIINKTFL